MYVKNVINNNIVSAYDHNEEMIIMGRGIGFKTHSGDEIDEEKIEKIFCIQSHPVIEKFEHSMKDIPLETLRISNDIISYANKVLNIELNQLVYISLTTHIHFALLRAKEKTSLKNELLFDIKRLYPKEYKIGLYALKIIKQKEKLTLPIDEAAFIALHIVSTQNQSTSKELSQIPTYIKTILEIISKELQLELYEETLHYRQFIKYLHFLLERIFDNEMDKTNDKYMYEYIQNKYVQEYYCSQSIAKYLFSVLGVCITSEEIFCLTLQLHHMNQVLKNGG